MDYISACQGGPAQAGLADGPSSFSGPHKILVAPGGLIQLWPLSLQLDVELSLFCRYNTCSMACPSKLMPSQRAFLTSKVYLPNFIFCVLLFWSLRGRDNLFSIVNTTCE